MPFLVYIAFFTRIPLHSIIDYSDKTFTEGAKTLPIVGAVIGFVLYLASQFLPDTGLIRGLALYTIYLFLTGGIHFDGLSDSCDGLFSGRTGDKALAIMSDSRVGSFGAIALLWQSLVLVITLSEQLNPIFFPIVGRLCTVVSGGFSVSAKEAGLGKLFIDGLSSKTSFIYLFLSIILFYYFGGIKLLFSLACAYLVTIVMYLKIHKTIGGQTGDTIGMIIEISQSVFLLTYVVAGL